jgi:hypothetical protein
MYNRQDMSESVTEKPVLDLNPLHLENMRKDLKSIQQACNSSFSGKSDWRAKQSYQKQRDVLAKKIEAETKKITAEHEEKLKQYNLYLVERD